MRANYLFSTRKFGNGRIIVPNAGCLNPSAVAQIPPADGQSSDLGRTFFSGALCSAVALVSLVLTCTSTARGAGMLPIFGPKQYVRTAGPPDQFTDTFQNCETAAQYNLVLQNGNPDGSGRISSASILVNGIQVIGPSDFNQQVAAITKPVTVARNNQVFVQLASQPGSSISVSVQCVSSCLAVQFTSPASGSTINQSQVLVTGNVNSTADEIGVVVNGIAALVQSQQFVANPVPLVLGTNTLTATATNACGNHATATENVTASALTPPAVTFRAVPGSGVTPLEVTITADVASTNPIVNYQWDFNGDGVVDASGSSLSTATTTYMQPGLFFVLFTATDSNGTTISGEVPILVLSPAALTTLLQSRWAGLTTALSGQNIMNALGFINPGFADQFNKIFSALSKQLPQIGSSLGPINFVSAAGGVAEFVTTRIQQGRSNAYFIYFMQDTNGLWKIVGM